MRLLALLSSFAKSAVSLSRSLSLMALLSLLNFSVSLVKVDRGMLPGAAPVWETWSSKISASVEMASLRCCILSICIS